jgi:hypothetical protein
MKMLTKKVKPSFASWEITRQVDRRLFYWLIVAQPTSGGSSIGIFKDILM